MATPETLQAISWHQSCLLPYDVPPPESVAKTAKAAFGYVPDCFAALASVPWVTDMMFGLGGAKLMHVAPTLYDLQHLVVAQDASCRYCYGTSRSILRMSGMSEEKIRALEADFHTADLPADQKAGLAFARKLARCNPRPDAADLQGLRAAGMSDAMVTELTTVVASTLVASRSMIMCAEPPAAQFEKMAFSPLAKVLGFVMGMRNTAKRMTKEPGRLPDGAVDGPFGKQLVRIDGMPKAPHFHNAVTGMLASTVLPKRTKLLVLAVVARTAQCVGVEIECRRLLALEGVDEATMRTIVDTLGGSDATPVEAALLPVARDTVRPQPQVVQPKILALRSHMDIPAIVEFIGTASLGNALSRIGCLNVDPVA